jgi:hypothetical protein
MGMSARYTRMPPEKAVLPRSDPMSPEWVSPRQGTTHGSENVPYFLRRGSFGPQQRRPPPEGSSYQFEQGRPS